MFSDIFSHSGYFFCLQVIPDFVVSYNIDHLQQMVLTFTLLKRAVAPVQCTTLTGTQCQPPGMKYVDPGVYKT